MGGHKIAKHHISITNKDIEAILHARKCFLYYTTPWVKQGQSNFDVTMDTYKRVQVYELISIFTLSLLIKHINKNQIELYRDASLAILVLFPETSWVKIVLSLTYTHSPMCIKIYIFNFKKQTNKQKENKNTEKAKETKEEKRISLEIQKK